MSSYRGIDLSIELQSMFDTIAKVKDTKVRRELLDNLANIEEEISAKSKFVREVIASLKAL